VSQYQKSKTNLDFTEAKQRVAVASAQPYANLNLTQTDNHASTPLIPVSKKFLQALMTDLCQ